MTLARLAQRAENGYVGVQCGLMDQFAVAHGEPGAPCSSTVEASPTGLAAAPGDLVLVVCHSGSPHKLESSKYNERRACERAAATIATVRSPRSAPSVTWTWPCCLRRGACWMRPRSVASDTWSPRTLASEATRAALEVGDLAAVGSIWAASHASLRNDFEVSSPELDALVEIASAIAGVAAARMTGGGFGGSTVNLVKRDAVSRLRVAIETEYPARTGLHPTVMEVEPVAGVGFLH